MRVLYVNHTAAVSGAERSLLSLLSALPQTVQAQAASPPGRLAEQLRTLGVPLTEISGTAGSLRLHPLHTPRALAEMALAAIQVGRAARHQDVEIVHANSIRAGLVLALARLAPAAKVVHVRDCLPPGRVSEATLRLIAASATTVIANSRYTAESVLDMAPGAHVEVLYNPVDTARFDPGRIDRVTARAGLGRAGERQLLMGVVAQLTPWKGQDTAIKALRLLVERGIDAQLLLIGSAKFVARSTRFDNSSYVAGLRAMVADAGLQERVSWLGEREDVPELIRALDVLLAPSVEEPFGRALVEAMALEVPVLATSVGGPAEIIREGREGHLLDPQDPLAWAAVLAKLAYQPERVAEMGQAGRARVLEAFTVERHVAQICDIYAEALGRADAGHEAGRAQSAVPSR